VAKKKVNSIFENVRVFAVSLFTEILSVPHRTEIKFWVAYNHGAVLRSVQKFERPSRLCYGTRCQGSWPCACGITFASHVGIPDRVNLS
jgi:hypothetical protein